MVRLLFPIPDPPAAQVRLEGAPFHHLVHVLRSGVGAHLELFDGQGRACPAQVLRVERDWAELSLGPLQHSPSSPPITLIQGLPKAEKMEWVLQKGTELGASAFAPASCARSIVKLTDERAGRRQERWERIVEEAARQCRRNDVPAVLPLRSPLAALQALPPGTRVFILDEEERSLTLGQACAGLSAQAGLALVTGPEGGLTREEVEAMVGAGARAVTLGPLVLRTETASLAALSVLRHLQGMLG